MEKNSERLAVCETKIDSIEKAVDHVCITDIPQIYDKLEALSNFSTETRSFFKLVATNTETLSSFNTKLDNLKTAVNSIQNQERLGRKEKASILIAVIVSLGSIAAAILT